MAKPVWGLMTIETTLYPLWIDVTPVWATYELTTVISDIDALTALSMIVTWADLDTGDVDVYIDNDPTPNGVMSFDTDHRDYVPWSPIALTAGHHTVSATFIDTGVLSTTMTLNFTTASLLWAAFHSNVQAWECPIAITFTDDTTNTPTTRWWDFGDGHFSNLQNPVHTYYQAWTYTVTLVVTSEFDKQTAIEVDYLTFVETTPGQTNLEDIEFAKAGPRSFPPLDANSVVEDDDRIRIEWENSRP